MSTETEHTVQLRRFTISDMASVLELIKQIGSVDDLVSSARAQFIAELGSPQVELIRLVATVGEAVVGTMGAGPGPLPSRRVLWANWLVVDQSYRRCGIASLLYAEIEAYAMGLGKEYLCLDVGNLDKERAAYLFHRGNGFQVVGQIPDYWAESEPLHVMAKCLALAGI